MAKVKQSETRTTTSNSLDALAAEAKQHEDVERAKSSSNNNFITLVQGNSGILLEDDARYIKGVKLHDYVIAAKKLKLGAKFTATVLGMFKLYAELAKTDANNKDEMAKTVSFWMPDDAEQVPVAPGENFDRYLGNGHVLVPVHWVYLYLHDYTDIDDALLSFRSTGNRVYKDLEKLVKAESSLCTELRFSVGKQAIKNDKYKTTNYYPKFDLIGRNYSFKNNKVVPEKGMDSAELAEMLTRSKTKLAEYAAMKLVGKKHSIQPLLPGPAQRAIAAGAGGGYEEDGNEDVHF